jgi:phosphoglucosamine mutase
MPKIFGTDGIRCKVNQEPMTPETCLKIAKTTGYLLSNKKAKKNRVIISKDTRLSGYVFEPLMTSGFVSMGMEVILVGPLPTPAVPKLITSLRADIGVMITASHNTYEYNGLKFFDSQGNKISKELENEIESFVLEKNKYLSITKKDFSTGKVKRLEDAIGRYSESLKLSLEKKTNFNDIKIVLDCGNGATYIVAPMVFWELGCQLTTIGNQPDGNNINYKCGAVNTESLSKKIKETNSDIGFAFDGDGDRLIVVDENGDEIDGDKILALLTKELLIKDKLNKKTVVSTVMSNLGFENYLKDELGVNLIRTAVGDINVIKKMNENSYSLGGEQSGHIIISQYSKTGDGILVALKVLEILKKYNLKASDLFNVYASYPQEKINISIEEKFNSKINKSINNFFTETQRKKPHLRFLVRKSGTEPLLRILVEGKNAKEVKSESDIFLTKVKQILNE